MIKEVLEKVVNEAAKKSMAHLIGRRAIPLYTKMMDRLGYSMPDTIAYHVTNEKHIPELVKLQHTKKQISTFTNGGSELAKLPSQPNVLVELLGTEVISGKSDIWTLVDKYGTRWLDIMSGKESSKKLLFFVEGIIQKIIKRNDFPDIDVHSASTADLRNYVERLDKKQRNIMYKEYIEEIERYIDSGGYKELNYYLKNSAKYSYNEVILTDFEILKVWSLDIESPSLEAMCKKYHLKYEGVYYRRDLPKIGN